jgi:dihydroorotate dehydrogenase electron transfer subunit
VTLAAPAIAAASAPGQFVMIKPAANLDPLLRRPFSVFEIVRDTEGTATAITLLSKRIGPTTSLVYDARPGQFMACLGPLGRAFTIVEPPVEAWMVAGGVGLAPFATLAESLAARGTPMTLFYGGRSAVDIFHVEFFERLGARIVVATEDGSLGDHGRVTAPLERALGSLRSDQPVTMYACGPTPMMRSVAALGARASRSVFVSLEPVMGCGMGGCYSCVVRIRRTARTVDNDDRSRGTHFVRSCLDGPVFDASAVVWDALTGH